MIRVYDGVWDCRFALATTRHFRWDWDLPVDLVFVILIRDVSYVVPKRGLFGVCGSLILVSGYLGFHIWGFLSCGEPSLFLSDVARLEVLDFSGSVG